MIRKYGTVLFVAPLTRRCRIKHQKNIKHLVKWFSTFSQENSKMVWKSGLLRITIENNWGTRKMIIERKWVKSLIKCNLRTSWCETCFNIHASFHKTLFSVLPSLIFSRAPSKNIGSKIALLASLSTIILTPTLLHNLMIWIRLHWNLTRRISCSQSLMLKIAILWENDCPTNAEPSWLPTADVKHESTEMDTTRRAAPTSSTLNVPLSLQINSRRRDSVNSTQHETTLHYTWSDLSSAITQIQILVLQYSTLTWTFPTLLEGSVFIWTFI